MAAIFLNSVETLVETIW